MLNRKYRTNRFQCVLSCIEVGDNVMIGAGSFVTKDIPDNSVAAGVPCRVIGQFDDLVENHKNVVSCDKAEEYWDEFNRMKSI